MQFKTARHFVKEISGRTVTGIFAVHGNVDGGSDRGWPGMFSKTFSEQAGHIRFLWCHDFDDVPTAVIKSLRELTLAELPPEVLALAPDATGGAEVTREYLDTPRGNEVLAAITAGAINEMSYAYDAVRFDFEVPAGAKYDWEQIRNLREVKLFEISDVLWGMNPATVGAKDGTPGAGLEWVAKYLAEMHAGLKAGARHSTGDIAMINQIAENALALGATSVQLIPEPSKAAAYPALHDMANELAKLELAVNGII